MEKASERKPFLSRPRPYELDRRRSLPTAATRRRSVAARRPRIFDQKAMSRCWSNANVVPREHPDRWRRHAAWNVVCFYNCHVCLCFGYDLIVPFSKDKELDIIEKAVYGDVIRPGKQCRCRTVVEMLGRYKSKDDVAAGQLPSLSESL